MTKRVLIIDDIRSDGDIGFNFPHFAKGESEPDYSILIARTYTLGIQALELMGPWDELHLDHDFGDPTGKTGYDVVCWIEQQAHDFKFAYVPSKLNCISSNASGIGRINQAWEAIQARLPELMEQFIEQYKKNRGVK